MRDSLSESLRRNIQAEPLRRALVVVLAALWAIFAAFTLHANYDALFGSG